MSHRTRLILTATTGLLAALSLAGCSSGSGDAAASGAASPVGGTTTCDDATISQALTDVLTAGGDGMELTSLDTLQCADGWAAAEATTSNGNDDGGVTSTYVFEAEGQFWVPKDRADVCGTITGDGTQRPDDAQVPADIWSLACDTN